MINREPSPLPPWRRREAGRGREPTSQLRPDGSVRELIEHLAADLRAEDGAPVPDVVVDLHAERVREPPQTITGQR
jgi:hypothetical protein